MDDTLAELNARLYLDLDVPVQLAGMIRAFSVDVQTTLEADNLGPIGRASVGICRDP